MGTTVNGPHGILLLVIVALVTVAACSDVAGPDAAQGLFGRWDVVRKCGGLAPGCSQPDQPVTFAFVRPDSARVEVAGSVTELHRFRIVEDDATIYGPYDAIHVWRDSPGEWTRWMVIRELSADSLRLADNMYDGYETELARAQP